MNFFGNKRNIVLLALWVAMVIALIIGITVNAVLFYHGSITDQDVLRRLWYTLLCFIMMSLLYVFEFATRLRVSLFLEIALPVFAFAALAGGTVFDIYGVFPGFDKILHTLSGPLFSIVGFSVAYLLLKNQPESKRKVIAAVVLAFLFALAVGYIWEIFEYSVDSIITGFNNQRWQGGVLQDFGDGTFLVSDARGTGLHDTMWDMIVNLIGTVAFLVPMLIACLRKPKRLDLFAIEMKKKD